MSGAPLRPGATIGILGGGQLGRMLAQAAARLGLSTAVYAPDALSPAFQVCARRFKAAYDDERALADFSQACDVVTFEFENVPAATLDYLAGHGVVRPSPRALGITQDRLQEKDFLSVLDIPVPTYRAVESAADLAAAMEGLGGEAVLKARRFGYDGKGQARLDRADEAKTAWAQIGEVPATVERMVAFDREISVLLARRPEGDWSAYPPTENEHAGGILRRSRAPADISETVADTAVAYAQAIAEALDFVGLLAVEMFVIDAEGAVLVNEIAPRVHNSGHWTIEGAITSQFEQHIRAIADLPLGATDAIGGAEMHNLLGTEIDRWAELLDDPAAHVHHYGKTGARPGRKMGHVTWVASDSSG